MTRLCSISLLVLLALALAYVRGMPRPIVLRVTYVVGREPPDPKEADAVAYARRNYSSYDPQVLEDGR